MLPNRSVTNPTWFSAWNGHMEHQPHQSDGWQMLKSTLSHSYQWTNLVMLNLYSPIFQHNIIKRMLLSGWDRTGFLLIFICALCLSGYIWSYLHDKNSRDSDISYCPVQFIWATKVTSIRGKKNRSLFSPWAFKKWSGYLQFKIRLIAHSLNIFLFVLLLSQWIILHMFWHTHHFVKSKERVSIFHLKIKVVTFFSQGW